jgi:phosphatidylinositol phospholipase C, delta
MVLGVVMLSENVRTTLYFLDTRTWSRTKIDTLQTTQLSFDKTRGEFIKLKDQSQLWSGTYMSIHCHSQSYDLVFHLPEELDNFLKGMRQILEDESQEEDPLKENIKKIWMIYDNDFSGKMEYKEFVKFVKDLNIRMENKSIKDIFNMIDIDKSGEIDFNEFVEWYKKFSSGSEFKEMFDQYSKGRDYLIPQDLKEFFTIEQNENVSVNEAAIIILQYKQDTDREAVEQLTKKLTAENNKDRQAIVNYNEEEANLLKFHLNEFKFLLYDKNFTNATDSDKLMTMQDMTRPMYQYYISSSHNTYLSGHQLYGSSSVEMYNYALLKGYRLVELDCWDGDEENGPVITHGFTFTSKIYLKDVLQAIRKSAFLVSEYPVILSIENHCNKKQQDMMADLFYKCLSDLYVLDPENPPRDYPSPEELKKTFIIKCSRPRIFKKERLQTNSSNNLDTQPNQTGGIQKKKTLAAFLKKKKNTSTNLNTAGSGTPKKTTSVLFKTLAVTISKEATDGATEKKGKDNTKVNEIESMLQVALQKNASDEPEGKNQNLKDIDLKKAKKNSEDTVGLLANTCGMLGTKLILDKLKENNYQPWDSVTVTEKKFFSYFKDKEKLVTFMGYTRNSFSKIYPLRMDSSNFDATKAWLAGSQIAAINAQTTLDDFTLLNIIFFQRNNNAGYILRPEKLNDPDFMYNFEKPVGNITLKLISGINLNLIFPTEETCELSMTASIIGSYADDESNKIFTTKINNNLLNPLFKNEIYSFNVYEPDLSFILIKISNKNTVLARSVLHIPVMARGIRTVPLYDNLCREFRDSILVFHITKKFEKKVPKEAEEAKDAKDIKEGEDN